MDLETQIEQQAVLIRNLRRQLIEAMNDYDALVDKQMREEHSVQEMPSPAMPGGSEEYAE